MIVVGVVAVLVLASAVIARVVSSSEEAAWSNYSRSYGCTKSVKNLVLTSPLAPFLPNPPASVTARSATVSSLGDRRLRVSVTFAGPPAKTPGQVSRPDRGAGLGLKGPEPGTDYFYLVLALGSGPKAPILPISTGGESRDHQGSTPWGFYDARGKSATETTPRDVDAINFHGNTFTVDIDVKDILNIPTTSNFDSQIRVWTGRNDTYRYIGDPPTQTSGFSIYPYYNCPNDTTAAQSVPVGPS